MDISKLDAEGRGLIFRAGDLRARFMLVNRCESLYAAGEVRAVCHLIHALEYLRDRLAYEMCPWPENCIPSNFGEVDAELAGLRAAGRTEPSAAGNPALVDASTPDGTDPTENPGGRA